MKKKHFNLENAFYRCPKCHVQVLILYDDGSQECEYCGFKKEVEKNG